MRGEGNRGNDTIFGDDGIGIFVFSEVDDWVLDFNTAKNKLKLQILV